MSDVTYQKFMKRWEQVVDLPPQTLGPLTPYYKWIAGRTKKMPWPVFLIVSFFMVVGIYLVLGSAVSYLVTLLQRGF